MSALPDKTMDCSFCGKSNTQVAKLVAGPGVFICDECIDLAAAIVHESISPEEVRRRLSGKQAAGEAIVGWDALDDDEVIDRMRRIADSRDQVDRSVGEAVRELRGRGITWARIGDALGMTRQSAWERYSGEE